MAWQTTAEPETWLRCIRCALKISTVALASVGIVTVFFGTSIFSIRYSDVTSAAPIFATNKVALKQKLPVEHRSYADDAIWVGWKSLTEKHTRGLDNKLGFNTEEGRTEGRNFWRQLREDQPLTYENRGLQVPPTPLGEDTRVLFMHVFKCAGSTLRRLMVEWAEASDYRGAIVVECSDKVSSEGKLCLHRYQLLDPDVQKPFIAKQKVLAGHFVWGFQQHVPSPYVMITTLRNPLELYVSGQQYINRKETKTMESATEYISRAMQRVITTGGPSAVPGTWGLTAEKKGKRFAVEEGASGSVPESHESKQVAGFIRRFVGVERKVLHGETLGNALKQGSMNLESFWLVGVVEQYKGFIEVLRRLIDPEDEQREIWEDYARRRFNKSPSSASDILGFIDPHLVQEFNASLSLQWSLYAKGVELYKRRCMEVLPSELKEELCAVRPPTYLY